MSTTGSPENKPSIYRQIIVLALPTAAFNIIEMGLGLTDLFMVRSFGPEATAALGINRQITFIFETMIFAVTVGVVALISQSLGRDDSEKVERIIAQSMLAMVALASTIALLGYLLSPVVLSLMQASPETAILADAYLRIYCFSMLFLGINAVGAAVMRAAKNPWLPLKIVVVIALLNVPLNYMFIHGALGLEGLGVKGAAVGTLLARVLGSVAFVSCLLFGSHDTPLVPSRMTSIDTTLIRQIFKIGFPVALAGVMRNGARVIFVGIVGLSALGVAMHASVGLGLQIRLISVFPALAFQVALATLVGNAIGRGEIEEAEEIGKRGVVLLAGLMFVVCGILFMCSGILATLFIADTESALLGAKVLRWFAIGQFFSTLAIGAQGALSGAGDTKPIARVTFLTQWLLLLPLTYVLLVPMNIDPNGPLIAWAVAPMATFLLLYARLLSGKWKDLIPTTDQQEKNSES